MQKGSQCEHLGTGSEVVFPIYWGSFSWGGELLLEVESLDQAGIRA